MGLRDTIAADSKRSGRDSNPRYPFGARFFSKEVLSTTQPPDPVETMMLFPLPSLAAGADGNDARRDAGRQLLFCFRWKKRRTCAKTSRTGSLKISCWVESLGEVTRRAGAPRISLSHCFTQLQPFGEGCFPKPGFLTPLHRETPRGAVPARRGLDFPPGCMRTYRPREILTGTKRGRAAASRSRRGVRNAG